MKIAYFVNSINAINWGGQATSSGIRMVVEKCYPDATFVPLNLPYFPWRKIKQVRLFYEKRLIRALLADDRQGVIKYLEKLNIDETYFEGFDAVCFNGEGAIHWRSGHLIRLMAMLYEFKCRGAFVNAFNQTVDLGGNRTLEQVVQKVYSMVDRLAVREPASKVELEKLGLSPEVIPDAAYAFDRFSEERVAELTGDLSLPERFIAVTGSSALKRNKASVALMDQLLERVGEYYPGVPIWFLANAKTDIYLAEALQQKYGYTIFGPPERHDRAMAVVARAELVVGGRQHPNIFAAIQGTPFVPLKANTHKMEGVVELLHYPLNVLPWDCDKDRLFASFADIEGLRDRLADIVQVPRLEAIDLGPAN